MRRNRIIFLILLVVSIIFLYNKSGRLAFLLFNSLLSLLLFSIAYAYYVFLRFKYVQKLDKTHITKGEKVLLNMLMCNEDYIVYPFIHISFFGNSLLKNEILNHNLYLKPRSKVDINLELEFKYRGAYEIGIKNFYVEDFLGLIRFRYRIQETKKIIVNPRIIYLDKFNLTPEYSADLNAGTDGRFEDTTSIKDIRKYEYGDSCKRIHWKLSAKKNDLLVKNFQCLTSENINIVMDYRKNTYDDETNSMVEDTLVESAIALIYYYVNKSIPVNLIEFRNKLELIPVSTLSQFNSVYKYLATVNFQQIIPVESILELYSFSENKLKDTIIITSQLTVDLYNSIFNIKMAGGDICVVYVTGEKEDNFIIKDIKTIVDSLFDIGVNAYILYPGCDIKQALGA